MKTLASIVAAAICLTGCVTAPTDPAMLAAWNAEKTARTEARRIAPGSVYASPSQNPEDFEGVRKQVQPAKVEEIWQ